jgi:hypothetical protein
MISLMPLLLRFVSYAQKVFFPIAFISPELLSSLRPLRLCAELKSAVYNR